MGAVGALGAAVLVWAATALVPSRPSLVMVVMDPLARPLACACVAGYAQRDYDALAGFLTRRLGQPVRAVYAESLDKPLQTVRPERLVLVIGKEAVVRADAQAVGLAVHPVAQLTGLDGATTQSGLFVVKASDPARSLADLAGRRILLGPVEEAERHSAALRALAAVGIKSNGVHASGQPTNLATHAPDQASTSGASAVGLKLLPAQVQIRTSCTEAALEVYESTNTPGPAAVISSYAWPLLEGCGIVPEGALRVVGRTDPVPFVTAFTAGAVGAAWETQLTEALLAIRTDAALMKALESKDGFVPHAGQLAQWPEWRGAQRTGQAAWLPDRLPKPLPLLWRTPLQSSALAGVAVADGRVIVADRDAADRHDVWWCLGADDGAVLWRLEYPAAGQLDYGASPRATPLIRNGQVYLLSALGHLHCVELATGKVVWKRDLATEFRVQPPRWGWCATPLVVDDKLVVNPGGPAASLVALNRFTGQLVWKSRGGPAAYASFIWGRFGGRRQIVGYDAHSLGGWDPATGRRLWSLVPPNSGDFNVPTPIEVNGQLLVATENNGTRLYGFDDRGRIRPEPIAQNLDLAPDCSSPVVAAGLVVGCSSGLRGLDLRGGLKTLWTVEDDAFGEFASLLAAGDRLLVASFHGELLLLKVGRNQAQILSRVQVLEPEVEMYAHPALADRRLYVRDTAAVCCFGLELPLAGP